MWWGLEAASQALIASRQVVVRVCMSCGVYVEGRLLVVQCSTQQDTNTGLWCMPARRWLAGLCCRWEACMWQAQVVVQMCRHYGVRHAQ